MLIQRRLSQMTTAERIAFNDEANTSSNLGRSASETAMADAKNITPGLVQTFQGGELTAATNRQFVRDFIRNVIPLTERAGFYGDSNDLSQDGERRIENALFSYAYGDAEMIGRLREDRETNFRAIGTGMIDAAPEWAVMRTSVEDSPQFDITQDLIRAVRLVRLARDQKEPVLDIINQSDAFQDPVGPGVTKIVRLFYNDDKMRQWAGAARVTQRLRFYATRAVNEAQQSETIFGDAMPVLSPLDILDQAVAEKGKHLTDDGVAAPPAKPKKPPPATRKTWTVYRGYGRPNQEAAYAVPGVGPIFGPGRYYAFERNEAERFGPALETGKISLDNPLIIRTNADWEGLARRAGVDPEFSTEDAEKTRANITKLRQMVEAEGHDGIAVLWDPSEPTGHRMHLDRLFDRPQVVDFKGRDLEGRSQEESMAPRQPLPADFPDAIAATSFSTLKAAPGYEDAKARGNPGPALNFVKTLDLDMDKLRAMVPEGAHLAPIGRRESGKGVLNLWPGALATEIAARLPENHAFIDTSFIQADGSNQRRGSDLRSRLADPPRFFGRVRPGATYVLVDDVVTTGGSLLQLAAHIQAHGGKVSGAIALATVKGGRKLRASDATIAAARKKHGQIEDAFRGGFGYGFDGLSQIEAGWLVRAERESVQSLIGARSQARGDRTADVGETASRRARGGGRRREEGQDEDLAMGPPGRHNAGMVRSRWNPDTPRRAKPITREKALRDLTKALGFSIYQGRIKANSRILGFYRPLNEAIRLKEPVDIETAIHEAGHLLDFRFPEIRSQWNPATKANAAVREELRQLSYDQELALRGLRRVSPLLGHPAGARGG